MYTPTQVKSKATLPPEVWLKVISFLRRPLPAPTGKIKSRSAIRQTELAVFMRVSKLNNLIAKLLYTRLIVDRLDLLVYRGAKKIKGIESKVDLLQYIEHLFLEYEEKVPTYGTILLDGGACFAAVGASPSALKDACITESKRVADAAYVLCGSPGSGVKPKNLQRLAIGVFCGGQKELWGESEIHEKSSPSNSRQCNAARKALGSLITHPQLHYTCMRVGAGPLAMPSILYNETYLPAQFRLGPRGTVVPELPQHNTHLQVGPGARPALLGGRAAWYCAFDHSENDLINPKAAASRLVEDWKDQLDARNHAVQHSGAGMPSALARNLILDIDVYLPDSIWESGVREQFEGFVEEGKKLVLDHLKMPKARYAKDRFELHSLRDAPPCQACFLCVDDLDDSQVRQDKEARPNGQVRQDGQIGPKKGNAHITHLYL